MVLVDAPNTIGKYHNEEVKTKLTIIVLPTKNMWIKTNMKTSFLF